MNEREREIVVTSSRKGEKIRTRRGENETVLEIRRNLVLVYISNDCFILRYAFRSLCDPSDRKEKVAQKKKKNTKERDPILFHRAKIYYFRLCW